MRNDAYLQLIGQRIKTIRKERKISIRKLGELCSLDYSGLSRIENGQKIKRYINIKEYR